MVQADTKDCLVNKEGIPLMENSESTPTSLT